MASRPILPIVTVDNFDEALEKVHSLEKPLAAYCFGKGKSEFRTKLWILAHDKKVINRWVTEVSSGGMCINDTIMHISPETLPFGGVGESGIGAYHGKTSFHSFSVIFQILDFFKNEILALQERDGRRNATIPAEATLSALLK